MLSLTSVVSNKLRGVLELKCMVFQAGTPLGIRDML